MVSKVCDHYDTLRSPLLTVTLVFSLSCFPFGFPDSCRPISLNLLTFPYFLNDPSPSPSSSSSPFLHPTLAFPSLPPTPILPPVFDHLFPTTIPPPKAFTLSPIHFLSTSQMDYASWIPSFSSFPFSSLAPFNPTQSSLHNWPSPLSPYLSSSIFLFLHPLLFFLVLLFFLRHLLTSFLHLFLLFLRLLLVVFLLLLLLLVCSAGVLERLRRPINYAGGGGGGPSEFPCRR